MKIFLLLTTLLIATSGNASEQLTLGMPNSICEGNGVLVNRGAPDFKFKSQRRFYDGFVYIQKSIKVLGLGLNSKVGLVVKQNGAQLEVFDPSQLDGQFFKKAGSGACGLKGCSYKTTAKAGDLILRETITPTLNGFEVTGLQTIYGVTGSYKASYRCKPLHSRNIIPDLFVEILKLID